MSSEAAGERVGDMLHELAVARRLARLVAGGAPIGTEVAYHLVDVCRLPEAYSIVLARDLDAEEVGNGAFVVDGPTLLQRSGERSVERMFVVVRVETEEVVDVDPNHESLVAGSARGVDRTPHDEHAVVGAGLGEAVREEPGEDGALLATTSLRHAVDRLDHLHHGVRRVHVLVTGRRVAPYDLVLE